ncbi:amino acid adenylation domain-containing protein [Ralstonia sp. 25mfcol4.1]|uniref:non-ribosomal peptide synthetase family protein n=1 Tax=Ralstonia sp. 25mfcol4.1 TaxID=1761899 RepID=UPI0008905BD1|nr:amino acid adenylation domain-containing protein [Ralstonia sp. 25mfcol4.1]SDP61679.1 amino acid adenylation domain-containing protein [Ralstonia sp. 25mfcol4.1]
MNAIVHPTNAVFTLAGHAVALGREQSAVEAHSSHPVTLTADIDGPLDAARLERALARVAERHPATGLFFGRVDGLRGLRQQFAGTPPVWGEADNRPTLQATVRTLDPQRSQLTLTAHPLAIDGASLTTLMRELAQAYADDTAPAGEAPLSYADYLDWTANLAQDDSAAGRDYWQAQRDRLAALHAPRLPWRQTEAATNATQTITVDLDETEATSVAAWTTSFDCPPAHTLQAVWWLLLARIDGAGAFRGDWHNDCRDDFEPLAGAVGRYASLLPVAVQYDATASFGDWLASFAAQLQQHTDWREHAPTDIATDAPGRIAFGVTAPAPANTARNGLPWPQWKIGAPVAPPPGIEIALHVSIDDAGRPRALALQHDHRHAADAMACLLDQYRTLLQTLRAQPDTAIGALPLATVADQARADAMHAPAVDFGAELLPERLARWASERPDDVALSAAGQRWTYAELSRRVDALASRLAVLGLRPGQPVGLQLPRSADLVIALLAVMRAGAPYLPLDPAWPAQRRAQILADAGATLVLSDLAQLAPDGGAPVAPLAPLPDPQASQPAYVLYTSGSTGTPKGVAVTHGQLLNYVAASGQALGLDRCERFALTSSVAADLGNTTLFGALWQGACLCVADDADMQHAAGFAAFLSRERVDCIKIVPSHLDALIEGDGAPLPLPSQAVIVVGGESASPAFLARLRERAPGARLFNHYGPTETTVGILVHDAGPASDLSGAALPLTRVLANCEARVRTAAGHPATVGETGELYLGGAQLCAGYVNRDTNTEAFVAHPAHAGQRMYRSGDLARYLPQGGLELLGRADSQVKVRGFRVECGEVEHALSTLPGVRQAVVLPHAPDGGAAQLAAWLVPADTNAAPLSAARRQALRQALAERLPDPMIPTQWFAIAELPRLPNGKLDRRALIASAALAPDTSSAPHREPATALEALLLDQMRDLLGTPQLGVTEDLFEAGGHSLLVIKLVARVRKLLKLDIAPAVVFDAPSAAALAAALRAASSNAEGLETLAVLQRQLAAMSPEARAALRASAAVTATA